MKTTVFKEFGFEAAHSLPHLPDGHKCKRLHGHSYRVMVEVTGEIDPDTQFVIDYAFISMHFNSLVFNLLDHQNINDFITPSTSENLAAWILGQMRTRLPNVSAVTVWETPTAGARVEA